MEDHREGIPAGAASITAALRESAASRVVDRALGVELPSLTQQAVSEADGSLQELAETIAQIGTRPQGVACDSIPEDLRLPLAWAGLPLVGDSPVRFGQDLEVGNDWHLHEDHLVMTDPRGWWEATSLAIKPVRAWIADRFQWRVQLAVGVRVWLWPETCILANTTHTVISGFLHGPGPGRRTSVALEPGEHTVLAW